ncbi:VIR protein [Plasmodium vivax]|uniref:VIR protein n=1 Tax=Plasmodium vivax TaxID=5855 RepID=A0A1G4EDE3_PLAVI|nr:VIR protein [Plasmodium vivax]
MTSTTLEKATEELELDKIYKEYFKTSEKSTYDSECNAVNKGKPDNDPAKVLCKKLLYFLEKIASLPKKSENADRCSYLRYWLYDEIGKIETKHSTKISQMPFVKDLFGVGNKVNEKIKKNTCVLPTLENNIDLDEWKKRKLSYIYFENYDKIKQLSSSNDKAKCKKYSEYVKSFNTLFEKYKKEHCDGKSWWFIPPNTHYFRCSSIYYPNTLLSELAKCEAGTAQSSKTLKGPVAVSAARQGVQAPADRRVAVPVKPERGAGLTSAAPAKGTVVAELQSGRVTTLQRTGTEPPTGPSLQGINEGTYTVPTLEHNTFWGEAPDTSNFLEKTFDMFKSDYFRHVIVGASTIGVLMFIYFFFKSTSKKSQMHIRERKNREPENNYYDAYEEEYSRYGSQPSIADSQMSDAYMPYQPRPDSYYY